MLEANNNEEITSFPPQEKSPSQHLNLQQHQGMQEQSHVGFGIDPNWGGFGQMMHGHGYHQPISGLSTMAHDPLEQLLGTFPCVRIRGLPYEATLEDILVFFHGLVVIDVVLLPREDFGEAFVVFANPMDFQMGLQRDHQNLGSSYLEISQGKRSDYYGAISSQQHGVWHGVDNLGGKTDLIESQTGGKTADGNVAGIDGSQVLSHGFGDGEAGNKSGPQSSLKGTGSWYGGGSPNRNNNYDYRGGGYGGRGSQGKGRQGGGIRDGPHTGFIRMRGLPYQATKQDIIDFFSGYEPIESSVLLTCRADGRSTGEGYVGFADASQAEAAMSLHRSTIGSRYIELFISNKEEHSRNMARASPLLRSLKK